MKMKSLLSVLSLVVAMTTAFSQPSFAETVTEPENASCGNDAARAAIGKLETGGKTGGYDTVNQFGYLGRFQVGEEKLIDLGLANRDGNTKDNKFTWTSLAQSKYGISSNQDFLNNPAAQEAIYTDINALNVKYLGSAMNSVGQSMGGCGKTISKESLLGGSQLGAAKVRSYISNGMQCVPGKNTSTNDANGVCVEKFMCAVAGCGTIEKDMNKKTCDVTMPIIEGIDCSKMPSNIRSWCEEAKPFAMTRSECNAAETASQSGPFGERKDQCENLSFGPGSGSWSFVLACSVASEFTADQDGKTNSASGPVSDPACIENLKSIDPNVRVLGQYNYSQQGFSCIVENAVSVKGVAVPFGKYVTMTCDLALAMEKWGQQLKGLGVTGYGDVQTLSCREMRTNKGVKKGRMSEHGYGRAADVPTLKMGGREISFGAVNTPLTPDGVIATQAKAMACSSFKQVLSPSWKEYKGTYAHFHVEWGKYTNCS